MGAHGQTRDMEWHDIPWPLRLTAYTFTVVLMLAMLAIVVAGTAWLVGHPFASQCRI